MTDDESKMVREIHQALFSVPAGAPEDEKPLIAELRLIVRSWRRANWLGRALLYGIPALAAVAGGIKLLLSWVPLK